MLLQILNVVTNHFFLCSVPISVLISVPISVPILVPISVPILVPISVPISVPILYASPSDNLISLSHSMVAFSANLFRLILNIL